MANGFVFGADQKSLSNVSLNSSYIWGFVSATARVAAYLACQYPILPTNKANRNPSSAWWPPTPRVSTTGFKDGHHERHRQPCIHSSWQPPRQWRCGIWPSWTQGTPASAGIWWKLFWRWKLKMILTDSFAKHLQKPSIHIFIYQVWLTSSPAI